MDERYRVLKKSLSQLSGIPSSSLLLVEVHAAMIRVSREIVSRCAGDKT